MSRSETTLAFGSSSACPLTIGNASRMASACSVSNILYDGIYGEEEDGE